MEYPTPPNTHTDTGPHTLHAPARPGRSDALADIVQPLRIHNYRLLFAGQLVSGIGDGFYFVALPWLVLSSVGGAQALGLAMGAYGSTRALTTIAGGWLSDRIGPRRVMLVADVGRMLVVGALASVSLSGGAGLGILCVLAGALGIFSGAFIPASFAITPTIVPDAALGAGNSLSFSYTSLATLIGPALAGVVIARSSAGVALAVDAATFLVSTLTLWAMRPAAQTSADFPPHAGPPEDARRGQQTVGFWRFLAGSHLFQLILLLVVAINLVLEGVIAVGLPALAHGPLRAGAAGYGIMLAVWGGGALAGGMVGSVASQMPRQGVLNLCIWTLQGLAIVSLALSGALAGALASLAIMGLCNGVGNVTFLTLIQRQLPRDLLGRMMGAISFGNFGLSPVSVVVAGFASARFGPGAVIIVGGALSALVMVVAAIPRAIRSL